MSRQANLLRRQKRAKERLERLFDNPQNVLIIHYACESFYEKDEGSSPRITSIAVKNLDSGQETSFSLHLVAERKHLSSSSIAENLDELEKDMLVEFFDFVERELHVAALEHA